MSGGFKKLATSSKGTTMSWRLRKLVSTLDEITFCCHEMYIYEDTLLTAVNNCIHEQQGLEVDIEFLRQYLRMSQFQCFTNENGEAIWTGLDLISHHDQETIARLIDDENRRVNRGDGVMCLDSKNEEYEYS